MSFSGPTQRGKVNLQSRPPEARRWLIARLGVGLTQADVARLVGISRFWIVEIENGHARPSEVLAERLLDLYGDGG